MNINIPDFTKANILVVGDVMLDRYWHGDTARISPEAPVPVVRINEIEERPGGASNVALNITALNANAALLGVIGADDTGKNLQRLLKLKNIDCKFQLQKTIPTITKLRVLSQHQQLIRLDFEKNFNHISFAPLIKEFEKRLANTDVVVISDYGKGISGCVPQLIQLANNKKIPVFVDPKGDDFCIYKGASIITPNLHEFETVVGSCDNEEQITEKGLQLIKDFHLQALLVTRGAQGMSLIQPNKEPLHIPTHAREVFDVTGAGDTVIATLAAAYAVNKSLDQATYLANIAAGQVVRKLGAATVTETELRHVMQSYQDSWLGIISAQQLQHEVAEAKASGEKIVMTNGCFDILHAGHVAYLEQAKTLGSRLIVAVNNDNSVKRLKGESRPINPLMQRMAVLSGLRAVDWVVPFAEDTPEKLISMISPDILVKGGDYKIEEIAGSKHVLKNGGEVKVLTFVDDQSTTTIINKLYKHSQET